MGLRLAPLKPEGCPGSIPPQNMAKPAGLWRCQDKPHDKAAEGKGIPRPPSTLRCCWAILSLPWCPHAAPAMHPLQQHTGRSASTPATPSLLLLPRRTGQEEKLLPSFGLGVALHHPWQG